MRGREGDLRRSEEGVEAGTLPRSREHRRLPLAPSPSILPRADEEGGRGRPPRVLVPQGHPPTSRELPLIVGTQECRAPSLQKHRPTLADARKSAQRRRTAPRVLCLQDVKSKQGGGQACREQESHVSRKVTVRGEAERPPAGPGLQGLPLRKETRRQACVAQREVLMGKAGKKLPTAMETSRKTQVPAGKQSRLSMTPSSLVSGWTSRTGPKGPPSTPRGAPRSRHTDQYQGCP